MAWSCSHAKYCDSLAFETMVRFRDLWKPHYTACLGDFIDMTAFMNGGAGGGEVEPDIDTGLMHLKEMRVNDVLLGNHEDRVDRMRSGEGTNAYAAHKAYEEIEKACKKMRARIHPYTGIWQKVMVERSDIMLTHGTWYNDLAATHCAEHYCNGITIRKVLFGHTHKVSIQAGKRDTGGVGYNVGTLTARGAMEYAKNRRSTSAWMQGFSFFEFCNELGRSSVNILHRQPEEPWRLPL
jgi:predicted phosphodiesterase